MTDEILRSHCEQIDACNQRGGRMLSIVDMLEAGTVSEELAAYLLAAISGGSSFMTGALPGGAGKTTVMCALLNFVPADIELAVADSGQTIQSGLAHPSPKRCYICHEIGKGHFYAYLWGQALRSYFSLAAAGHILATNLHADTFQQAFDQVCGENAVPQADFRRMNVVAFISLARQGERTGRTIAEVWESDGAAPHKLIYRAETGLDKSALVGERELSKAAQVVKKLLSSGARTVEEVRKFLLESYLKKD
ncbi:MAG: hypothetical protein HZA50_07565 [Planctomycetes bacterium]|nr:hypothetical protein [Planctomycetota bacterium]